LKSGRLNTNCKIALSIHKGSINQINFLETFRGYFDVADILFLKGDDPHGQGKYRQTIDFLMSK